jgi:anthranilate phosphoribosyltransferase
MTREVVAAPDQPAFTWPSILAVLISGEDIPSEAASWAMSSILSGEATPAQTAGFVTALRAKGESATEVQALVETMLAHAILVPREGLPAVVLDVVGTGGDSSHSVNISTMAALIACAAGAPIIKHGNRAASSSTGTADVLEELGVAIALSPEGVAACVSSVGMGFCFAPAHHPALRHAAPARKELGIPTIFNILGPLSNPGRAEAALVGCANLRLAPVMADVLLRRGVKALVVRGEDGLDEISTTSTTRIWDVTGSEVVESVFDPTSIGIARVEPALLVGGERTLNADLLRQALDPTARVQDADRIEAIRSAVTLNAAAALVLILIGIAIANYGSLRAMLRPVRVSP